MPRRTGCKLDARASAVSPGTRRSSMARAGYLAPAAGLIGIPKLQPCHGGEKIGFGSSALTMLAASLVEIRLALEADWAAAQKHPSAFVDQVLRRFLADHGQAVIAQHFELCLTLVESIIDSAYGEPDPAGTSQLFFVLNTESSFALGIGSAIDELESAHAGLGEAFYDSLRQSLYRWVRVYDDWDARERIEQMAEWAEGEEDPDSYEIPKLEPDLPACLRNRKFADRGQPLKSFSLTAIPRLKRLVELTLELERVSHAVERPKIDEDLLERERDQHSLDSPLPAILLYFHPGDGVMACFDNECEFWGQETPEPNLIVPLRPDDPDSVRHALAVVETLLRVLVLAVEIKQLMEPEEEAACASASMSVVNSN
jgi:hypothetical protein